MAGISRYSLPVLLLLAAVPIYTTWIAAGMRSPLQDLLPVFAGLVLLAHLLVPQTGKTLAQRVTQLLRDPFIWCMIPVLALILLQWSNAGRTLVYEATEDAWILTDPPRPGWPSAINPYEAREMWNWFLPVALLTWTLRARLASKTESRLVSRLLMANAGLLAASGILILAQQSIQDIERPPEAFATFGYQNHAGVFFSMILCVTFGQILTSIKQATPRRGVIIFLIAAALICIAGAFLSLSRAGMVFASIATLLFLVDLAIQFRKDLTPVRLLNSIGLIVALGATVFFIAGGTNATWIKHEVSSLNSSLGEHLLSDSRMMQLKIAGRIWVDQPWFGTGAWGFRHVPGIYATPAEWQKVVENGAANVHCDFMQFLSELGLLGMCALLAAGGVISFRLLEAQAWMLHPELRWTLVGFGCVCVSSLIDLPFRNTAILQHSILFLALAAPYSAPTQAEMDEIHMESI